VLAGLASMYPPRAHLRRRDPRHARPGGRAAQSRSHRRPLAPRRSRCPAPRRPASFVKLVVQPLAVLAFALLLA
jgi:hypothetical protein